MSKVIIINGASGAGKSFLLEKTSDEENMVPIRKYTTRKPRTYEDMGSKDLYLACTEEQIEECDYKYEFRNELYGIKKEDIDDVIKQNKSPIVIIRDYPTIMTMKEDYKKTVTIYVQGAYSGVDLKEILLEQGRKVEDIKESLKRNKSNFKDYIKYLHEDVFDCMIVNYYDDTYMQQVKYFLQKSMEESL